jgi:hypothetical protein
MFKIVFTKLVQWCIPVWLRVEVFNMLVLAGNYPLREAHNSFQTYCEQVEYRIAHNFETWSLEELLNDAFDVIDRRIRVVAFAAFGNVYLFEEADVREKFVSEDAPLFVYPDDVGYDFTVQVPTTIITTNNELAVLKSKMALYKLAGKNYFIERI